LHQETRIYCYQATVPKSRRDGGTDYIFVIENHWVVPSLPGLPGFWVHGLPHAEAWGYSLPSIAGLLGYRVGRFTPELKAWLQSSGISGLLRD